MSEISLEKIDTIRERTNVSYTEAKEALEASNGDIVEALIYIENKKKDSKLYTTKEEFINWIKDIVEKGQVTRIKIKKDEKTIVDVPANAAVAGGIISVIWWPIAAIGIVTAVATKVTIEITKTDGSVEVINKIIKTNANKVKDKMKDMSNSVKNKVNNSNTKNDNKNKYKEENVYKYTVKFEDLDNLDNKKDK